MLASRIMKEGLRAVRKERSERGEKKECQEILADKGGLSVSRALWGYWEQRVRSLKVNQLWAIKKAFALSWVETIALICWWMSDTPPPPVRRRRRPKASQEPLEEPEPASDPSTPLASESALKGSS